MIQYKPHRVLSVLFLILFGFGLSANVSAGFFDDLKNKLEEEKSKLKEKAEKLKEETDKTLKEAKNKISPNDEEGKEKSKDKNQIQTATNQPAAAPSVKAPPAPEVTRRMQSMPTQVVVPQPVTPAQTTKPATLAKLTDVPYPITGFGENASLLGITIGMNGLEVAKKIKKLGYTQGGKSNNQMINEFVSEKQKNQVSYWVDPRGTQEIISVTMQGSLEKPVPADQLETVRARFKNAAGENGRCNDNNSNTAVSCFYNHGKGILQVQIFPGQYIYKLSMNMAYRP